MSDDLKELYESISTKFDVGSFDEFSAKMETEDMRKSFYDTVSGKGIDLGDYEEYESRLKKKRFFSISKRNFSKDYRGFCIGIGTFNFFFGVHRVSK